MSAYRIHYILPAMGISDAVTLGPVVFCTTRHLDNYTITPPEDARSVQFIAANCRPAYGHGSGKIGLMLVPAAQQAALERDGIPRMCRDALALAYITAGTALCCHHGQATTVHNADYFDSLPIRLRGDGFILQRPGLLGITHGLTYYKPTLPTYLSEASDGNFQRDDFLRDALERAIKAFVQGRKRRPLRQLFRAIAISLHATRIMPERDSTYFDLGVRITSWVSAFETLVHPGKGRIGLDNVLALIQQVRWVDGGPSKSNPLKMTRSPLEHRRYVVSAARGRPGREKVACHLYRRLYNLRNDVAHGNPIQSRSFAARSDQRKGPRIDQVMPLLFRECLLERLRDISVVRRLKDGPLRRKSTLDYIKERLDASSYHEALAKVLFR